MGPLNRGGPAKDRGKMIDVKVYRRDRWHMPGVEVPLVTEVDRKMRSQWYGRSPAQSEGVS